MTIHSKYNYRDRIYWMENNKVRTAVITVIQFGRYYNIDGREYLTKPTYQVSKSVKSSTINWNGGVLKEEDLFLSKADLLKSL